MRSYDCPPTLDDSGVLEFCRNGYLMLEAVVPDRINRQVLDYLDGLGVPEPTAILVEDWFVEGVIQNAQAAGAVRSLLGPDFRLPGLMSNHREQGPFPAAWWHVDGGSVKRPDLTTLQVFYYPQETTVEMGPTEVLPGSHHLLNTARAMGHLGRLTGSVSTAASAGSIFITVYHLWHRRGESTSERLRNMLKYNYFRTTPPRRDWIVSPDFHPADADYGSPISLFGEQSYHRRATAEMFYWLCGKSEEFAVHSGQSWPFAGRNRVDDAPPGFDVSLEL
jgi:ectoine hydroxylase-related dioxygenase (phytanoyl-CoA dioxygenase family)